MILCLRQSCTFAWKSIPGDFISFSKQQTLKIQMIAHENKESENVNMVFLLIKKIQALPLAKRPQTQKGIRKSFCLSRILTWKCGEIGTVMPPALINRVTVTSCRCSVYQLYVLRAKFATENNFDDSTVHDMICREPFLCPKVIHLYLIMNWNKKKSKKLSNNES